MRCHQTFHRLLLSWFQSNGRHHLPWRQSPRPYDVLVSEFMLQQTTVATIIPRFQEWMQRFPTLQDLAIASEQEVLSAWQGLGYYARARRLHRAAQAIVDKHQGIIPRDLETLLTLPGIGPYTASALLAFAFDEPIAVLDTNIIRVIARLYNFKDAIDTAKGSTELKDIATSLLPKKEGALFASALMDIGATICVATNPHCPECPLATLCQAEEPTTLPRKKPRAVTTTKKEQRLFYKKKNRIYLEESKGPHWKGLWILPLAPSNQKIKNYITSVIYPITRYRVTMQLYHPSTQPPITLQSFAIEELQHIAIPSPHRKAIAAIQKLLP